MKNEYIDDMRDDADVPLALYVGKYEETDFPIPDLDDYRRGLLSDLRPEVAKFEHEKSRSSKNFDEKLKLRYEGHRGTAIPFTEGRFTDIMGSRTDRLAEGYEPRGNNVDPDFKQLNKQNKSRLRFIRFTAENDEKITGGYRTEARAIKDRVAVDEGVKSRLKIFDRQLTNLRPGRLLAPSHAAAIAMASGERRFDDQDQMVTVVGVGGHRPGDILYREAVSDQDFSIAYYGDASRKSRKHPSQVGNTQEMVDVDIGIDKTRVTIQRAATIIKRLAATGEESLVDGDFDKSVDNPIRKRNADKSTLFALLAGISDQSLGVSGITGVRKLGRNESSMDRQQNFITDHIIESFNVGAIVKGLKPSSDFGKISSNVLTAQDFAESRTATAAKQAALQRFRTGNHTSHDADLADANSTIVTYKTRASRGLPQMQKLSSHEKFGGQSDTSRVALTLKKQSRRADNDESVSTQDFFDNQKADRHIGKLGRKNTRKYQDEQHGMSDNISDM